MGLIECVCMSYISWTPSRRIIRPEITQRARRSVFKNIQTTNLREGSSHLHKFSYIPLSARKLQEDSTVEAMFSGHPGHNVRNTEDLSSKTDIPALNFRNNKRTHDILLWVTISNWNKNSQVWCLTFLKICRGKKTKEYYDFVGWENKKRKWGQK